MKLKGLIICTILACLYLVGFASMIMAKITGNPVFGTAGLLICLISGAVCVSLYLYNKSNPVSSDRFISGGKKSNKAGYSGLEMFIVILCICVIIGGCLIIWTYFNGGVFPFEITL